MKLWPGDEITGLLETVAGDPNSKWEKPEAFFIKLNSVKKIDLKLRLWQWKMQYGLKYDTVLLQQNTNINGFKTVMENKNLRAILSTILRIGNCMNASNKLKGQADGFEIDAIEKCMTIKDSNGNSIMKTICEI